DLRATLAGLRRRVASEAERHAAVPLATGTNPFRTDGHPAPGAGFTCGCHVQVAVESPEEGAAVVERIRPWLPVLIALAANSPFWRGADTDYASYRTQVLGRRPGAGVGA